MKPYLLRLCVVLSSGVERKYEIAGQNPMTKAQVEKSLEEFKEIIHNAFYNNQPQGELDFTTRAGKNVQIKFQEIALVEYEIIQM